MHYATNPKVAGSIPEGAIVIFYWHKSCGPGIDSASNRNECQEYFLGGKGGLHVPIVLRSGSLKILELYGPVQACNGIALPLQAWTGP